MAFTIFEQEDELPARAHGHSAGCLETAPTFLIHVQWHHTIRHLACMLCICCPSLGKFSRIHQFDHVLTACELPGLVLVFLALACPVHGPVKAAQAVGSTNTVTQVQLKH